MPYDREWEESEDFEILEDILFSNVAQGDYDEEQLHNQLAQLGPYEAWEGAQFTIDDNADVTLIIWDENGQPHDFNVAHVTDAEWDKAYQWIDERGIDYDIEIDSEPKKRVA